MVVVCGHGVRPGGVGARRPAVQHGGPVVLEHGEEALTGGQVVLERRQGAGPRAGRDHVDGAVAAVLAPKDSARSYKQSYNRHHEIMIKIYQQMLKTKLFLIFFFFLCQN